MSAAMKNTDTKGDSERQRNHVEAKSGRKPIVLSYQRFNKIVINSKTTDRTKALAESEEEQKYKDKLKADNDELVAQFKGNMQRTQEQKLQQTKDQRDKKNRQVIENYEKAKENETQKRQEKIAKAEQIMARLKPGPRELHSAVLQSEVLRARNVQRSINEEFKRANKKQEFENRKMCNEQALSWIGEEQQRLNERQMNTNAYKRELLQTIKENQKQRHEEKSQMIREEQATRVATNLEIKTQMEKEMAMMEKKREALRKKALEAMKIEEQRRLRDRVVEELEDRLCCVYNTGKAQLEALRKDQIQKLRKEQQQKIDTEIAKLSNTEEAESKALESERIRRDITTMQLKFTAEEQEKVRKDKAAKQARIEAHLREMQQKKEMQLIMEEGKRFETAQRLKNAEVNCLFEQKQRNEKLKQFQKVRTQLNQQIDDNKKHQLTQQQNELSCTDTTLDKEHKYFFEHARNLMEDAQQKGRPLHPFIKVVSQYKRDNKIDCESKIVKHLQSNVPIGDQNTETKLSNETTKKHERNSATENILQNCLKINEIINAATNTQDDTTKPEDTTAANVEIIRHECIPPQFRYSMNELKEMNQFAAPTCH